MCRLEKGSLRRALAGVLPEEVLARPKRAFLVPSLLGTEEGKGWAADRILGGPLAGSDLFDRAGMARLLAAPSSTMSDGAVYTLAGLSRLMDVMGVRQGDLPARCLTGIRFFYNLSPRDLGLRAWITC